MGTGMGWYREVGIGADGHGTDLGTVFGSRCIVSMYVRKRDGFDKHFNSK